MLLFELSRTFNPDPAALLEFLATRGGYEFAIARSEARFPIARQPNDAPAAGFVPLRLEAIPAHCDVLGWHPAAHRRIIGP